jgi:thiosulfate/3-mercaptopyruvate sulfurtransferase
MSRTIAVAALLTLAATPLLAQDRDGPRSIPPLVTAEWLAERLDAPDLVVLHVDESREGYDQGHIPGASFVRSGGLAAEVDGVPGVLPRAEALVAVLAQAGLRNNVRVVAYGDPVSAARAWMILDYLGNGINVAILDGGLGAWEAAGQPLSTEPGGGISGTLSIAPQPERLVNAEWVLGQAGEPYTVIIDSRPLNEYTGEAGGNGQLAGHVPSARHLSWQDLLVSPDDPRLLPEEELRARFEAAGAVDDKVVVVYGSTGMSASLAYFVSRMLGYETYFYDGSWHDWSTRDLPTETGPDPGTASR